MDPTLYLFLTILLTGITSIVLASFYAWKGIQATKWPSTEGQVLNYYYSGSDNKPLVMKVIKPLSAPSHEITIEYEYLINDEWKKGSRIYFGKRSTGNRKKAYSYLERFPVGSPITVYVAPDNPDESVLIPGVGSSTIQLYVFGLLMSICGGWLSYIIFKSI